MLPVQRRKVPISGRDPIPEMAAASSTHPTRALALIPAALTVLALVAGGSAAAETLLQTQRFQFELWAQNHCPADVVVWVHARSRIYSSSEERW